MASSKGSGNRGSGVAVKVRDSGMQGKEFLRSLASFEAELSTFLLPSRSVGLLNQIVAAAGRDDLNVLNGVEHGKLTQCCPVAPQLVGVDDLRDLVLTEQPGEEEPRCPGIAMFLKQDVEDSPRLIHSPPEPILDPTDLHAHLVQKPPGTPTGFSVAELFGEEWRELNVPLSERFVTNDNPTSVEEFLNVPLAEGEAVVQPQGVPDDAQRKTVAVGLPVSHNSPAYRHKVARTACDENCKPVLSAMGIEWLK